MAPRSKKRPTRGINFSAGYGGGFIYPAFTLDLDTSAIYPESDAGTVVGLLTPMLSTAVLTLIDSDGGKFTLTTDNHLVAGAVPLLLTDGPNQSVNIRVGWGGRIQDFVKVITITTPDLLLSGSHTLANDSAEDTVVGTISSHPTGAVFTIQAQDVVSGFKIVAGVLKRGPGVLVDGAYAITLRATKGGEHWDQAFTLTLT